MRLSRILIILLLGVLFAQTVVYYSVLPEIMASHFDGSGNPDGWMTKRFFFGFEATLLLFLLFIFTALPALLRRTPNRWINLPNKDYWLSADRRSETLAAVGRYHDWVSIALILLFITVNQLVFQANLNQTPLSTGSVLLVLLLFFAFISGWIFLFVKRFNKPE